MSGDRYQAYTHQVSCLGILFWCLLQPSVCSTNAPIALVDELENVGLVLLLESSEHGVVWAGRLGCQILGLEPFGVRFRAGAEIHFLHEPPKPQTAPIATQSSSGAE